MNPFPLLLLQFFTPLIAAALITSTAPAAVFGSDDRLEVTQDPQLERTARATAIMISPVFYEQSQDGTLNLDFPLLSSIEGGYGICSDEKFANQPSTPVNCTGFLIAPDLLMTAGHCMVNHGEAVDTVTPQCESFSWLFDYQIEANGQATLAGRSAERLVKCKKVLYAIHTYDFNGGRDDYMFHSDFALVQLERPLPDRPNLRLAEAEVEVGDRLWSVGYPLGLPAKGQLNAKVTGSAKDKDFFVSDLDIFGGDSGSPVLNDREEVVGIVVRAFPDEDFVTRPGESCSRVNRCAPDGSNCISSDKYPPGTQVQRIAPARAQIPATPSAADGAQRE